MSLEPLRCAGCGSPAPLAARPSVACPACAREVAVPADYLAAARLHEAGVAARAAAESVFARLLRPAPWTGPAGLALLALAPPAATLAANLLLPDRAPAALFGVATLPALLPGAALWTWSAAAGATARPYREALAAAPPPRGSSAPGCRSCGAPLDAAPGALSATCLYCGTDSLLERLPLGELGAALRGTLTDLRSAVGALRRRRLALALGLGAAALLVAALSAAVVLAVLATA